MAGISLPSLQDAKPAPAEGAAEGRLCRASRQWGRLYVRVEPDGRRTPLPSIDLEQRPLGERPGALADLRARFAAYQRKEEELTSRVPAPEKCGYGGRAVSMSTDSISCGIDLRSMDSFERIAPCRELFTIASEHEAWHATRCQARKGERTVPAVLLTPGGHALEEVVAYEQEIGKLRRLLSELEGRRIEIDGTAVAAQDARTRIRTRVAITLKTGEDGAMTGEGELREHWEAPIAPCRMVQAPPVPVKVAAQREGEELVFRTFFPQKPQGERVMHCPKAPPFPMGAAGAAFACSDPTCGCATRTARRAPTTTQPPHTAK